MSEKLLIVYKDIVDEESLSLSTSFEFNDPDGSVVAGFTGEMIKADTGFYLTGEMPCVFTTICDRCGQPAQIKFDVSVSIMVEPTDIPLTEKSEYEMTDSDGDIFYSGSESLDLHELLRQEAVLNLPTKRICSENCESIDIKENDIRSSRSLSALKHALEEK